MAGSSVSITTDVLSPVQTLNFAWVSDSVTGSVSGSTSDKITGRIVKLVTIPDGTAVPTDLYDITLTDGNSVDVLQGLGSNQSVTTTLESNIIYSGTSNNVYVNDVLTLNVTNAGNSKQGTVIVYYVGA